MKKATKKNFKDFKPELLTPSELATLQFALELAFGDEDYINKKGIKLMKKLESVQGVITLS